MYLWIADNGEIKRRHQMIIIQKNVSETALFFTLLIQSLPLVFIFIVMPLLAHIIDVIDKK